MELDLSKTTNVEDFTITREYIESKVTEDILMSTYYGVPVQKGLFKAKHRNDSHPTVGYFKSKEGRLFVKDFGSTYCGDWIYVIRHKFDCSYYKALKIAAIDFNLIKDSKNVKTIQKVIKPIENITVKNTADIRVEIKEYSDNELKWWKQYGITKDTLKKFKVFSCKNIFLNGELFHLYTKNQLIFGYYLGKHNDLENWKIYFPGKKYRFISNLSANMIQGARMLSREKDDILVITKSMKDVMCLYECGIQAIAPNSENLFVTNIQYQKLKERYKHIVLFYDNDLPGLSNMNKIRKKYKDLIVVYIPLKYETKDFSDFYKKYGKNKALDLIEQAKNYYMYETKK